MRVELVGRSAELSVLVNALNAACSGEPRLVLCGGEPGIGKTRIAEEITTRARERGVPVLWGRGAEGEGAPPYWPWRQILRGAADLGGAARAAAELQVERSLAVIAGEGGGDVEPTGIVAGEVGEPRFHVFDAVGRFLRSVSDAAGLMIVLDDLHGADRPSQQLLVHLVRDLAPSRLLVVATYRDTEPGIGPLVVELTREPAVRRIGLVGLTDAEVCDELAAITGSPVAPDVAARVHDLTRGNPLFVAELARVGPGDQLPASLRAAIDARLDRTSPLCRHLLRVASVLGRAFSVDVVSAVVGSPVLSCLEGLDEAMDAGLLEPGATVGEHRFVHALVRDAVEAGLPRGEHARLHRGAAEAIATVRAGRLEPHLSDIARHWMAATEAGECRVAVDWAEHAARAATDRVADAEAARLYGAAIDHGGQDLEPPRRCRLLLARAVALRRAGELADARAAADRAAAAARYANRPDLLAEAALVVPCVTALSWERAARALCREALTGVDRAPTAIRARVLARLAETGMYVDALDEADEASREALVVAAQGDDPSATVAALRARALVRTDPDGIAEREELAERMFRIGRQHQDPTLETSARSWRIDLLFARGDLDGVAAELEQLAWCADEVGGPVARWWLQLYRGTLAQARGELAAAVRHLDEATAVIAPVQHPAAFPIAMSLRLAIDRHLGADPTAEHVIACRGAGPGAEATPGHAFRIMDLLCPATVLAQAGFVTEAAAKFRALGPVAQWRVPPYHLLPLYVMGVETGIRVGAPAEVSRLRELLGEHRGQHAVSGKDVTFYCGPVELALGRAAAFLDRLDDAVDEFEIAATISRRSGAAAFEIEANVGLAAVLDRRGRAGDRPRARDLVAAVRPAAQAAGMTPLVDELTRLSAELGIAGAAGLTRRERQVADCVARGLSNRQVADELFISERTVENHVQHIFTKLGLSNRSQVAVWARS